jgi:membrane-associated phospholipid phosphatase
MLDWGVPIVLWLQELSPALDGTFRALTRLGENAVLFAAMLTVYWSVDKGVGRRILLLFFVSVAANTAVKDWFDQPRPATVDQRIVALAEVTSPSFPSGHVQSVTVVGAGLAATTRRPRWGVTAAVAIAAVALSRMYLGVHLPPDVVAGAALALALVYATVRWGTRIEERWFALPSLVQLAIPAGIAAAGLLWRSDDGGAMSAGMFLGLSWGFILERRRVSLSTGGRRSQRIARVLVGLVLVVGALTALEALIGAQEPAIAWRVARYAGAGLVAAWAAPWLFVRVGLAEPEPADGS